MKKKVKESIRRLCKSKRLIRGTAVFVLAVMLLLPAGNALAAGLLRLGSRGKRSPGCSRN